VLEGAHHRTIRCVSWSPCGRLLAATSFDGTTSVWSNKTSDFECIATLEGHENEVKGVAWSASGAYLATCSRDKSVWIFEGEFLCTTVFISTLRKLSHLVNETYQLLIIISTASYSEQV